MAYSQQERYDLLHDTDKFIEEHPTKTLNQIKTLKNYYLKKGTTVEKEPNPTANQTTVEQVGENLVSTIEGWYEVVTKNAEGVAETHRLYKHSTKSRPQTSFSVEPVVAANITRSRSKLPKRNYNGIFVFSDSQIGYRRIDSKLVPIHDETAIRAAQKLANDLNPNVVVDCGDTTDFAELSRFPVDSDHFLGTLQPSLQRTHNMLAEFTAATPNAERHTVGSNHVKRLGDFMLKNAFPLYNIRAAGDKYPALSYPNLLKLDDIGWEFHDGYGSAAYEYSDDLVFIHGTFAVSQGSTAAKLSKANYGRNIVQGHKHSIETHYSTDRKGDQYGAFVVGALCRRDGYVPSYHSSIDSMNKPLTHYENWQNGVMYIKDYGEGIYQFDHIPITNGIIHYNGREYSGHEQ